MRALRIPRGIFNAVCYTEDGEYLVGLHSGWRLRVWATSDLTDRFSATLPGVRYHHDTMQLASDYAVMSQGIYSLAVMWGAVRAMSKPVSTKDLVDEVEYDRGRGWTRQMLAPDGRTILDVRPPLVQPRDGSDLLVKDLRGNIRQRHELPSWTRRVAGSPDGRNVVLLHNKAPKIYNLDQKCVTAELHHSDVAERALFSPDGTRLAVAAGRSLWLWDLTTKRGERFPAFDTYVEGLAYSPDGTRLAAADRTGEIRLMEVSSGRQLDCLNFKVGAIHDLAFSPDGMTVAGAGHDNAVVVWDLE